MKTGKRNAPPYLRIMRTYAPVIAVFAVILCVRSVWAQTGHANIAGVVTDSQGAVVPQATVTATNTATGVAVPATTNQAGAYNIIQLIPGVYNVKVEKQGFSTAIQESYTLVAEQNAGINFVLKPGSVSQQVVVQSNAQMLHTETAELSQTINEVTINELPLNGRNPASLVLLTPGAIDVSTTNGGFFQSFTTFPTETGASLNGGRQGSTYYLLDGVYNMDNYQLTAAPFPNPDATAEFSVIGNNFDPRFGFTSGGVVSIVTKSGTNSWHGDLFEFFRNGKLNARDYFTGLSDQTHHNQYGGSLGGPLKKDKLFVFGNYQGTHITSFAASSTQFVPSDAMRAGDFSALCQTGFTNGLCNDRDGSGNVLDQIWKAELVPDHSAADAIANPSSYYGGNFINPANFNSASVALTNLFPHTTNPLGQLIGSGYSVINDYKEGTGRVDYNINDHQRIMGRAFVNTFDQPSIFLTLLNFNRSWVTDWQNYGGNWTWTINPHMVNSLSGSYTRLYDSSSSGEEIDGKPICFSQFINVADKTPELPTCSTIQQLGAGGGPGPGFGLGANFNGLNRWTWGASDSLSISHGKHLLVAGVDVLRQFWYLDTDWTAGPLIYFDGGPNGNFTGYGLSDFLMGDASSFYQSGGQSTAIHAWMFAPYFADQIKVSPHLTVSAGLRWEPYLAPQPETGRIVVYWPGHQSTRYPNAPPGVVFSGDAGVDPAGMPSNYGYFNPRLGIAWQPDFLSNMVIRSAFGMYSSPLAYNAWNATANNAPFSPIFSFDAGQVVNGQVIPIIPFSDPYSVYAPTDYKSPFPPFAAPGSAPGADATFVLPLDLISIFDRNFKAGQSATWNLSVERQFGQSWLARAAYVGVESYNQSYENDLNPGQFFCGPVGPNCSQAEFNMNGTLLNPEFSQLELFLSHGTSSYNAGQFTLERRMAHGLQFTANYTYSKTLDVSSMHLNSLQNPYCLSCNRAVSDLSFPQILALNFIYQSPSLSGRNFLTRSVLGGWEISGIYHAQSGPPLTIFSGLNQSYDVAGQDHADFATGNPGIVHVNKGNTLHYLEASDFMQPGYGSQGNTGRNIVTAPGENNWDVGMDKNFHFAERYRFQFRWEMFNAFNRPAFGPPDNYLTDGTFGQIFYSVAAPRAMQLAGKLYF